MKACAKVWQKFSVPLYGNLKESRGKASFIVGYRIVYHTFNPQIHRIIFLILPIPTSTDWTNSVNVELLALSQF